MPSFLIDEFRLRGTGLEFEDRIRINEAGNAKFNFLKPNDPYHAYYRHKITEIQEGVAQEAAAAAQQAQVLGVEHVTVAYVCTLDCIRFMYESTSSCLHSTIYCYINIQE